MPLQEQPWEVSEIKYYVQTDMAAASIGMAMVQGNQDIIQLTPTTQPVPVIWKDFFVYARDLAASQRFGLPLDVSMGTDAARRVAELEELLIWEGTQGFVGFMGLVGRDTNATIGTWATAGNAYIDIKDSIIQLQGHGFFGPYKLIVSPAQYGDLFLMMSATSPVSQLEKALALCSGGVYSCPSFADNADALVVDANKTNFELRYSPLAVHSAQTPEGDYFFRTYEAVVPWFKSGRALSVVDITGITV